MCEDPNDMSMLQGGALIMSFETASAAENALDAVRAAFRGTGLEPWIPALCTNGTYLMTYADYIAEETYFFPVAPADFYELARLAGLAAAGADPAAAFAGKAQFSGSVVPYERLDAFIYTPADRTLRIRENSKAADPVCCPCCGSCLSFPVSACCGFPAHFCPRCGYHIEPFPGRQVKTEEYKVE